MYICITSNEAHKTKWRSMHISLKKKRYTPKFKVKKKNPCSHVNEYQKLEGSFESSLLAAFLSKENGEKSEPEKMNKGRGWGTHCETTAL